jgi:integrin alpha FG-GAP repeat containing protein 1
MDTESKRMVLKGSSSGDLNNKVEFSEFIDTSEKCMNEELYPFSNPHSAAFLDLNGDCLSDLFFTSSSGNKKFHEVWLRTSYLKYCLTSYNLVDSESSQVTFADFNSDGRIDYMYAIKNKLYLQRNRLSAPNIDGDDCVSAGTSGIFTTPEEINFKISKEVVKLYEDKIYGATIRVGDYNLDGYDDILFTWEMGDGSLATYLCETDSGLNYDTCDLLTGSARAAAFFDIDEDGLVVLY